MNEKFDGFANKRTITTQLVQSERSYREGN